MTTASGAFTAIQTKVLEAPRITDAHGNTVPVRWKGDDGGPLADVPAAFVWLVFTNQGSGGGPASFGGGRGANLYRNRALAELFVFAPNGEGPTIASDLAETFAARLRSFRDSDVSCFSADVIDLGDGANVKPAGLDSAVDNYQCALVEVSLHFDQIG